MNPGIILKERRLILGAQCTNCTRDLKKGKNSVLFEFNIGKRRSEARNANSQTSMKPEDIVQRVQKMSSATSGRIRPFPHTPAGYPPSTVWCSAFLNQETGSVRYSSVSFKER